MVRHLNIIAAQVSRFVLKVKTLSSLNQINFCSSNDHIAACISKALCIWQKQLKAKYDIAIFIQPQPSNATIVTEVLSASACLFASKWRPLVSVITTIYYVATIIFHWSVCYSALSLHYWYVCIQSSGIILIPRLPLCQILFLLRPPLLS